MNHFSRIGFILAAAGSAVGLGNIWKFPYITGEYGGGAFVLVYLLAIVFIGLSVFLAEAVIGQNAQADIATAFIKTSKSKNKNWKFAGFMIIAGLIILSFYSVVLGWILNYIFTSFGNLPTTPEVAGKAFNDLLGKNITGQIIFHTIIAGTVIFIVLKGIKAGIEKINLILMPLLAIILIGLLIYALTLDSFSQAISFMFSPNWAKIDSDALLAALGQAFFTLSLGVGTILTYSASLPRKVNFVKSSIMVAIVDTAIAIIAGLIIFSFLFEAGAKSTDGPGLVFISLPVIFSGWGMLGHFISVSFFIALVFAGITSAVSMIEPALKFFTDRFGMTRLKATIICGTFFYVFGIIALLSMTGEYKAILTVFGKNAFDWMDFITSSFMMPLAAILTCVFLGYFVDKELLKRIFTTHVSETFFNIWYNLIKFLVPIAITILLLNKLGILDYLQKNI
ncbi:sodium-dependent transporter [Malaciobacter molluscorum LMG 25693]|uniref:Transporter n=1 Tax=Malaciobacter molluscorum LMG 25693 TaxID=870501 RepID=A0A2G1DKD9_9BACT|nr:sodium-dependent transporter [Malaciobacter molluscorum]AXX92560.1 sodium-dependent transporter, SNF family [Malaciobacter molluscorum LMG 25693]PHO18985.1 sodium-dependent transporter [Malaciobacter molluscorum LMG 25693]